MGSIKRYRKGQGQNIPTDSPEVMFSAGDLRLAHEPVEDI
jgi:hypothetical protein